MLINPVGFSDPSGSGLNIGLGYLASSLITYGCEVRVLDFENLNVNRNERLNSALLWKPNLIGVTCTTFSVKDAIKIIKYCRKHYSCFYIAGGPHVTMNPKVFMEKHKDLFDCIAVGESDQTILEIVNIIRTGGDFKEIRGIAYFEKGEVVITKRELIADLDRLPFPNYHVFDSVNGNIETYPIITERGCPYGCVFCLSSHIWKRRWRARTPENVIAEIKHAVLEYGFKTLSILDDNFTLPSACAKNRAKKICDLIIAENLELNIILPNGVRADSIDEELLQKLKLAGCSFMMVGVEDVAADTINKVGKGESQSVIKEAVQMIKKVGIKVECSMVIGLIDATFETTIQSVQFLEDLGIKGHWVIAVPFPNTALYSWVNANGRFLLDVNEGLDLCMVMFPPPVPFDTLEFTKDERIEVFALANIKSKNYSFLFNHRESFFKKTKRLLFFAWKYDRGKFLNHLLGISVQMLREVMWGVG